VYSPKPTESTASARRAKEVDFTARNFATIALAAQGLPSGTGQLAGDSLSLVAPVHDPSPSPVGSETLRSSEACSYARASLNFLSTLGTRMLRNLKSLLAALALLLAPALAHAEEPTKSYPDCGREPTDAEVQAAKGAFQAGNASFNEADYARAIDYWEDAYRRDCTANPLLLNLARAYELAGRKRQAVVALETFQSREPNSGEKDQISRRVEVLKKKIAEEDAAAAAAPPPPTGVTPPVAGPPTGPVEPTPSQKARRSPWPWVVMGVGGAVLVVGAVRAIDNKKKIDDVAAKCPNHQCVGSDTQSIKNGNDARAALNGSVVVMAVGGAAIVGGAIWWFLDKKSVDQANGQASLKRPLLTPFVAPQLAGLSVSGAF
jgi:tetratricopeptide (TPR) repeat protein